jgi:hypothetical protein
MSGLYQLSDGSEGAQPDGSGSHQNGSINLSDSEDERSAQLLSAFQDTDMELSGNAYTQPLILRERGEVVWFISSIDELLSQRWSQYITIFVTKNPRQTKTTPLPGAILSYSEIKL